MAFLVSVSRALIFILQIIINFIYQPIYDIDGCVRPNEMTTTKNEIKNKFCVTS